MDSEINKEKIIEFLFDSLSQEEMSLIADMIVADKELNKVYQEEKDKLLTQMYADGELTHHDRIEFEYKLKSDKILAREVELQKRINESLQILNLREILKEICNGNKVQKIPANNNISFYRKYKYWMAAASIALLLAIGSGISHQFLSRGTLENRLYASYYEPLDYTDCYELNNNSFNVAKQKYMDGDYINALNLFKKLPGSLTIEVEKNFFIALSLMEIGEINSAIGYFESILANEQSFEFTPQINWYLGLCYLKSGDKEKTIACFNPIVEGKDYNYKKARKILKKLSN